MSMERNEDIDDIEEQLLQFVEDNKDADPKEIMQQLLDSDSTLTSRKMAEWLMKPGIAEILINFVTRNAITPAGDAKDELSASLYLDSSEYFYSSERRREALLERIPPKDGESDSEDDGGLQFTTEAKRADKAAEVLASHIVGFNVDFIEAQLPTLIKQLFQIFDIKAEGDFDNFCKVFENLLTKFSGRLITLFSLPSPSTFPPLLLHFLNYLHDPSISESLLLLLKPLLPEQLLLNFYNSLNSIQFFPFLSSKISSILLGKSSCEEASDFFLKLLDHVGSFSHADVLFHSLGNKNFLGSLVDGVVGKNGVSKEQQIACIWALRGLVLKSGEQLYDQSVEMYTQTPLPNMLRGVRKEVNSYLRGAMSEVTGMILREKEGAAVLGGAKKFSRYTVERPVGMSMMGLLEVVLEVTEEDPEGVFRSWNKQIWRVFVNWCFDNCWNNIYHSFFWKMFLNVFKVGHEESMRLMLSKYKLLSKLIDHYLTTKQFTSGFRGYIIKICNFLRLHAETLPASSFLRNFLSSHESWKQFLPILREETIGQLVTDYPPPLHIGLINPFLQHDFSSFTNQKPMKPITHDDAKIDLGSKYADALGFAGKTAFVVPGADKRKRKRKNKKPNKNANSSTSSATSTNNVASSATSEKKEDKVSTTGKEMNGKNTEEKNGNSVVTEKSAAETNGKLEEKN